MCAAKDLKLSVLSDGRKVPVGYTGQSIPCRNEAFDGTIFFCHKPPKGSSAPWAYRERLEGYGAPDWLWEAMTQSTAWRSDHGLTAPLQRFSSMAVADQTHALPVGDSEEPKERNCTRSLLGFRAV
eukprot:Skav221342  [mRNA]  locus=scaffold1845:82359:85434:- [translate_table: standard]